MQFPIIVLDFLFAVLQLFQGIGKLFLRICFLLFKFLQAVLIFLAAVQIFFLSLCLHIIKPLLPQTLCFRFHGIHGILHLIIIVIGVDVMLSGNGKVDLREIIGIHGILRNIDKAGNTAAAYGGCSTVHVHVHRRRDITHHRQGAGGDDIQVICIIVLGDLDLLSQNAVIRKIAIGKTLPAVFRHPPAPQSDLIQFIRDGIEPIDLFFLFFSLLSNQIQIENTLGIHDPIHGLHLIHLFLFPAVGADQAKIKHILLRHVRLPGIDHIRFGHQQTYKNGCTQGNDCRNGNIASQRPSDGAQKVLLHCISFHYHSISPMS